MCRSGASSNNMLQGMKQFVPSAVCLSCDGCCRFKEQDSRWRPKIAAEEKEAAAFPGLAGKIFSAHVVGQDDHIAAVPCQDLFVCHFFNPKDNTCWIYHARPFECQLYPFLLSREEGRPAVFVHLNCPYVQKHWGTALYKEYVAWLKNFFQRAEVRDFIKRNPGLIANYSPYRQELDYVFIVDLGGAS